MSVANILVWNGVVMENKRLPAPIASHDAVVQHPSLFWDTLRRFHAMLGTKFMVPVIGGKELNLHVLYVEVTRRGGYEKVVFEKKWREVGSVFKFSPTTTSASYVLRRHYHGLLHSYEQVYFFKLQGPLFAPTGGPQNGTISYTGPADSPRTPHEGLSIPAVGTIDAKFDSGYIVSVKVGSEIFKGVLYHPEDLPDAPTLTPEPISAIMPCVPIPHRSSRRSKRRGRDPNRPKPNRSGYNFFFSEKHASLKSICPHREREFTKMIGEAWGKLSSEERTVYQNIGLKDKERYRRELKEYKKSLLQSAEVEELTHRLRQG